MERVAKYEKTFIMARRMGKNRLAAARIRMRYLWTEMRAIKDDHHPIVAVWRKEMEEEYAYLDFHGNNNTIPRTTATDGISDSDVESAREYPVAGLVEFQRNKATAWCHDDQSPSLFHADRINKIICPVCDRKFNAIDILMTRDGYSFSDAVKQLR